MNATLRGLAALALFVLATNAQALVHQFTFTQSGYEFGAYLKGSIYVNDANDDGFVEFHIGQPFGLDSFGGHMVLVGHPIFPSLAVPLYEGWINVTTMAFNLSGDAPAPWNPHHLIDGFISNDRAGFTDLLAPTYTLYSTAPVVLQRVPENLNGAFALIATMVVTLGAHLRKRRR